MIIATGIDESKEYWDLLLAFLASVENNANTAPIVCVYLINRPKSDSDKIKKFSCVLEVFSYKNEGGTAQKSFTRHKMIPDIMRQKNTCVAWFDPDCIVRKFPFDLFSLKPDQIKIILRPNQKKEHLKLQSGVYFLGCSPETIKYSDNVYKELIGKEDWYYIQTVMFRELRRSYISQIDLREDHNDCEFLDASPVWHGKHSRRSNPKFQKELKKYINIGKEIIGE